MQSWESFTNRYPRLRLSSFLSRKGIKSFDEAVTHFKAMGVEPCEEALRKVFGIDTKVVAASDSKSAKPKSATSQEIESSPELADVKEEEPPKVDENNKVDQAIKPTRRRTSRSKKSNTETPE